MKMNYELRSYVKKVLEHDPYHNEILDDVKHKGYAHMESSREFGDTLLYDILELRRNVIISGEFYSGIKEDDKSISFYSVEFLENDWKLHSKRDFVHLQSLHEKMEEMMDFDYDPINMEYEPEILESILDYVIQEKIKKKIFYYKIIYRFEEVNPECLSLLQEESKKAFKTFGIDFSYLFFYALDFIKITEISEDTKRLLEYYSIYGKDLSIEKLMEYAQRHGRVLEDAFGVSERTASMIYDELACFK